MSSEILTQEINLQKDTRGKTQSTKEQLYEHRLLQTAALNSFQTREIVTPLSRANNSFKHRVRGIQLSSIRGIILIVNSIRLSLALSLVDRRWYEWR